MRSFAIAILMVFFSGEVFAGNCRLETPGEGITIPGYAPKSQGASGESPEEVKYRYKMAIKEITNASNYPGSIGVVRGGDVFYQGPANLGFVFSGVRKSWPEAKEIIISPKVYFSSNWKPSGKEYCSKHKTKITQNRVCVEKKIAYDPTYVSVFVGQAGQMIHVSRLENLNNFSNAPMKLPMITCDGAIENFDILIGAFQGGTVDFTVHRLELFGTYRVD